MSFTHETRIDVTPAGAALARPLIQARDAILLLQAVRHSERQEDIEKPTS